MKMKRKVLSLLLCVVMLVSTCPQIVSAEYFQENGISAESDEGGTEKVTTPQEGTEEVTVPEENTEEVIIPEESTEEVSVAEESTEEVTVPEESTEETAEEEAAPEEESTEEEAVSDAQEALFLQELATGGSVTVSTSDQFERALNNSSVSEIIVTKRITLSGTAESSDYSISPVMIRGNVTIKGNGSGILTLRSPIQLTGDNVTFQDIEMNFISSGALGSVPHREIFLAGHTLTLDNVSCYTKGSDGSLGGFGGDEAELLPTVYAGGYRNTTVQQNGAGLTIKNANDKTNIQAIYAGHDAGVDNKVPYTGTMNLVIDARTAVRDGIFASANAGAVNITVSGQNIESCRTKYFEGNDKTTITFDNVSVNRIAVNGGNITLANGAIFEPVEKTQAVLGNIEVPAGTTLNLASMPGTVIQGDFKGGGTLILDKDDALTVNGQISGSTTFKTWGGSLTLAGSLVDGKAYIKSTSKNITGSITLDANYGSNYSLALNDGVWTAKNNTPSQDREFGSFEVLSAPVFVDYDKVREESLDSDIEPSFLFLTETKDKNGDVYVPDEFDTYVLRAEDVDQKDKTDYGTGIFVMDLGNWQGGNFDFEGKYYISFGTDPSTGDISGNVQPGKYVVFFAESDQYTTVGQIVDNAIGSAEFTIYKNEGTASKEILDKHVSAIPDQKYTGKEIKPSVQVTVDGTTLSEGTDYIVRYENNVQITSGTTSAKAVVEGIGGYKGTVEIPFAIVKGETETKGALTAGKNSYTYGEVVKLTFTAEPKKETGAAYRAGADKADFYCGNTLLGSADVVNGKAVLLYDTAEQKIPAGSVDITVDFGGNSQLEAARFTQSGVFALNKRVLERSDISSVSLQDFVYEPNKKTTAIIGIHWADTSIQGLSFEGEAQISSDVPGTYSTAEVKGITLTGEWSKWYDDAKLREDGNFYQAQVNPALVVRKAQNPGDVYINKMYDKAQSGVEVTFDLPAGYVVETYGIDNSAGDYDQVIRNVKLQSDKITFDVLDVDGKGTICVKFTSKFYEDLKYTICVEKTSKEIVDPGFQISDMEYSSDGYVGWSVGPGYSKDDVTVTYYDVEEQKDLGSTVPANVGRYRITLRYEKDGKIAEATTEFEIKPRELELRALNRNIEIGAAVPSLDSPKEGVDYEFVSGGPDAGESVGTIKMAYADVPDAGTAGQYEIQIGVVGNVNENYSVKTQNAWLNIGAVQEYGITVNGGHASADKARAGETVTVTADVPAGKEFVRWSTQSAGVTFANAESAATTFVMPANEVELTAEFKDKEAVRYEVKVTGGHANVQSAKAGETVTVTADVPTGKEFVRWSTQSAGVTFANAESAVTTFAMPANNVEITVEYKDKSTGGNTGSEDQGGNIGGDTGDGGQEGGNHTGGGSHTGGVAGTVNSDSTVPGQTTSPQTGEDGISHLWYIAMFVSFAGIFTLRLLRRREE